MPKFTTSDGLSLHYTDQGTGLPVLCLSGLTRNGSDFDFVAPHLDDVRLIRLDYRGRGQSDWAPDYSSYNVLRESQDVVELLDHLGLAQVAILGTSRGGLNALVLAMTARDRLLGVAFNDIGPELDPAGLSVIMDYIGRNPASKTHDEAVKIRPKVMAGFANVPESRWRQEVERLFIETPDGLSINYDPKLRDAVIEAGAQAAPDMWPLFDALNGLPLAVIRGENSDILPRATFDEMRKRRPDMRATNVPDRGHIPFLDEAESLTTLNAWLDDMKTQ